LLGDLYDAAEEVLRLGHKQKGRSERVTTKQQALRQALGLSEADFDKLSKRLPESYWIAEPEDILIHNAQHILEAGDSPLSIAAQYYPQRGATLVTVYAADHPGLFYRIAGAIHVAGGNIIDARIHTAKNGTAVDNFLVQDPLGRPFSEAVQLARLKTAIADALANRVKLVPQLAARPLARPRAEAFDVRPRVEFDNDASNRFTVIEVNARDRPALLNRLARALFESRMIVHSAHIATYGERAADTFYVTDLLGEKVTQPARLANVERHLIEAAGEETIEVEAI
jgi:[protein-PII] uridylyltransferase